MRTETITWHPITEQMPDDEMVVLCDFEAAEVWPGWHEADGWYDLTGAPVEGVVAWADMPEGIGA